MTKAPTTPVASRKKRHARADALRRKAEAQAAARAQAEAAAEKISPRAQRRNMAPVALVGPDGRVTTAMMAASRLTAEISPAGKTRIVRTNPVRNLAARQAGRTEAGKSPMITPAHVEASEKLIRDWDEVGAGVNVTPGSLLASGGRTGRSGGDGAHVALQAQIARRERLEQAVAAIGTLMDVIEPVVLRGVDLTAWAATRGWDTRQTVGYLAAALTMLVEFYDREAGRVSGKKRGKRATL